MAAFVVTLAVLVVVLGRGSQEDASADGKPAPAAPAVRARIDTLEQAVRERPDEAEPLVLLAAELLQSVRQTADPSAYTRAGEALDRAVELEPRNPGVYTERGILRLARHDFSGALSDGRRARRLAPQVVKPYGVVVDANVELGRYREAERVLQKMVDLKPNLDSYARVAYLRELRGDLDGASVVLGLAASAGGETPENVAFVETLMGNLELAQGRDEIALRSYRRALSRLPDYPAADAGLARLDIAAGRLEPAIERLQGIVERRPLQEYIVLLGESQIAAGQPEAGQQTLELLDAQQQLLDAAGVNSDAETALVEADHGDPSRAVELGRAAYAAAPSVRAADALGWALTRSGKPEEGLRFARKALRLGSRDASYLFHAGMSARAAGKRTEAADLLRRSLGANPVPSFTPLQAQEARKALDAL